MINAFATFKLPQIPSVAAYAIGLVLSKMIALFLQPLLTRWLPPEEFGNYAVLIALANLVSIIMLLGMIDCMYRFRGQTKGKNDLFHTAWTMTVIVSAVIGAPFLIWPEVLFHWLPGELSAFSVRCLIGSLILGTHSALQLAKLRMDDKSNPFMVIQLIFATVQAGAIIVLTPRMGVDGIMLAGLYGQIIQWIILHRDFPRFTLSGASQFIRYGVGITISGIIGFIALGAERWVLGASIGTAELAVYAIAAQWALAATLLLEPYGMWWYPKRFANLASEAGKRYAAKMSMFGCELAAIVAAVLMTIGCPFLTIWLPEDYHVASDILPLLAWVMFIKYLSTQLNIGVYYQDNADKVAVISLISAIYAVIAMFLLIPNFGLLGAIFTTFSTQLLRFIIFLVVSQKILSLPYRFRTLGIHCLALITISAVIWLQQLNLIHTYMALPVMLGIIALMTRYTWSHWQRSYQGDLS